MLLAWIVFPALCAAVSLGCGLLVQRLSGGHVAGALLAPIGLAAVVVVARACTLADATAELATPLVVALATAGFWLGRERLRHPARIDRWPIAAACVVFAVYAAPIVLSGSATFAGYTILGDTAVHFALVDWLSTHGSSFGELAPSSFRETLASYIGAGYPLGSHAALGALRPLAFTDVAWVFQPFLAFLAAMLALTLIGLLRNVVRRGWRIAAVAAIAAQPALAYAYALQGSIKEVAAMWLVPLIAATVVDDNGGEQKLGAATRRLVPLAIASAAGLAVIGLAVVVWLGPMLVVALVLVARRDRRKPLQVAALAVVFAILVATLSIPTLADAGKYLDVTQAVVTSQAELGNLVTALPIREVAGIWLTGDYRYQPSSGALTLTYVLIGLAAVGCVLGTLWLLRRRAIGPALFVASSLLALWYVTRTGSPWADAKALAIASPPILMLAALGAVALEAWGARIAALPLAVALSFGVVGSNVLAYHDASLAPRDRLEELADVGERAAGQGPLLYTEFEEFGKYFLREADPVGASEGFFIPGLSPELGTGGRAPFGQPASLRTLRPQDLDRFRILVQRRSPYGERPPGRWSRVWSGKYYELWRNEGGRPATSPGVATCPTPPILTAAYRPLPAGWAVTGDRPPLVHTAGAGTVAGHVTVRATGRYEVWLSGSFGRDVTVRIDGAHVGAVGNQLSQPAGWIELASLPLRRGRHRVEIVRGGASLAPGSGGGPRRVGSVVLRPTGAAARDGC